MSTHSVSNFYVKTIAFFDAPARQVVTLPQAELIAFFVRSTSQALVEYRLASDEPWVEFRSNAPSVHLPAQRRIQIRSDAPGRCEATVFSLMSTADDMDGGVVIAQEVAVQAESAGVNYNARSGSNANSLTSMLKLNSFVSLTKPGQYLFGGPGNGGVKIPANRTFACANGVELILADQSFSPIISAARQFDPGIAATGPIVYGGSGANITGTIPVNAADLAHLKHPVGSWVAVLDLDLSNQSNRSYQGVYQVQAVTPTSIVYWMIDAPPSGGNSTTGARIYPADTGIRIINGMWDGNGPNNSSGNPYRQGDPNSHIISLRNTQDTIVSGTQFRRGYSWSIGTNNIRDATFRDLYGDLYGDGLGSANAIFQGSGGARNVLIENVSGTCEDNMVAWSLDTVGQNRTGDALPWTYQNHANGDVYDLRIRNVHSSKNNATIVNFWGNNNARYHSVEIDGVGGRVSTGSLVGIDNGFDQTDMFNANGGIFRVSNVRGESGAAAVSIRSDGTWDLMEFDNVRMNRPVNGTPAISFSKRPPQGTLNFAGTVQTIKRLVMKNLDARVQGSTNNRTGALVTFDSTNVNDIEVNGCPIQRINANTGAVINVTGAEGTIGTILVSRARGEVVGAFSDACLVRVANSGAASVGQVVLRDCTLVGFTDGTPRGGLVHQVAGAILTKVRLDNTPVPALVKAGNVGGCIRDGSGMTVDTVSVTTL